MKVEIKGVILYDTARKKYIHRDFLQEIHIKAEMFHEYVFICEHTISIDIDDIDLIKPQLDALDAKEKELTFQYKQALEHIKVERNNLLALEN